MRKLLTVLACVGVAGLLAGCGTTTGGDEGNGFEWEYLFEDDTGAAEEAQASQEGGNSSQTNSQDAPRGSSPYRLKVDDTIMISLLGIREFRDTIEDRVDEEGNISLPYLEPVRAEGKTSAELERDIEQAFIEGDIYKDLSVKVVIPDQSYYYVRGEVKRPGRYPWKSGTTLSQAISSASGKTEYSSDNIYLTRGGKVKVYDLDEIEDNPDKDVILQPDDQIRIKRSIF